MKATSRATDVKVAQKSEENRMSQHAGHDSIASAQQKIGAVPYFTGKKRSIQRLTWAAETISDPSFLALPTSFLAISRRIKRGA